MREGEACILQMRQCVILSVSRFHAHRICRKAGLVNRSNSKPGRHLPPGHPQLQRVQEWVKVQLHRGHYDGRLLGNFDQIWSLNFSPARKTLQRADAPPDDLSRQMSLRRIRHCVERVLSQPFTEGMGDTESVVEVHKPKLTGGQVAHCPAEGYRIPRTLTSLSWADGTLGRGFITCRRDTLSERQREEANEEIWGGVGESDLEYRVYIYIYVYIIYNVNMSEYKGI